MNKTFLILALIASFSILPFSAHANDEKARAMMGIFGAIFNQMQQHEQKKSQDKDIQWNNLAPKSKADEQILKAQAALKTLGFYEGKIDGIGGPFTAKAIKEWQVQMQRESTGVLTEDEQQMLFLGAASKQEKKSDNIKPEPVHVSNESAPTENELRIKSADSEAIPVKPLEPRPEVNATLGGLPTCDSDEAVEQMKSLLGDQLLDWDKSTFCENGTGDGVRQCIGHFTLRSGEARLAFTFRKMKSDAEKLLVQVEELPDMNTLYNRVQFSRGDMFRELQVLKELRACDLDKD